MFGLQYFLNGLKWEKGFNGVSSRKEYWLFTLYYFISILLMGLVSEFFSYLGLPEFIPQAILTPFVIYLLFKGLFIKVRRFHDVGLSGWWILLNIIVIIGHIITFIFTLLPSKTKNNNFLINNTATENTVYQDEIESLKKQIEDLKANIK